jgi:hypothetical protein
MLMFWLEDLFSPLFSFSSFCTKKRFQISHAAGEGKNAYIKNKGKSIDIQNFGKRC